MRKFHSIGRPLWRRFSGLNCKHCFDRLAVDPYSELFRAPSRRHDPVRTRFRSQRPPS